MPQQLSCHIGCFLWLQPCVFKVDYTVEQAGNKEFGSVFLQKDNKQENVALAIVQNGWAKVRDICWSCNGSWYLALTCPYPTSLPNCNCLG